MLKLLVNLTIILICVDAAQQHRDTTLSPPELIAAYGYPAETHSLITDDGYILTMHRIPYGVKGDSQTSGKRRAVLVMHGLQSSSMDWVVTKPHHALGFILADNGFDVWLGNFRGNKFSKNHVKLSNASREYWDFSWHENGKFDLPAMIDYIKKETQEEKIFYIGHSMGTTAFFVMISIHPQYNRHIKMMYALAPVVYVSHISSPLFQNIATTHRSNEWLMKTIGMYELLPNDKVMINAIKKLCQQNNLSGIMCTSFMLMLTGCDAELIEKERLPVILSHYPAGSSSKQLLHYAQEIVSEHFREWDLGRDLKPLDYNLGNVNTPIVLVYSDNDWISNPTDVTRLFSEIERTVFKMIRVPHDKFNHMDFLWAQNAKELVYDSLIDVLKDHSK